MRKTFRQQFPKISNLAVRSHSKKNGTPRVYVQSNITIAASLPLFTSSAALVCG
jgi:hypothetical protein